MSFFIFRLILIGSFSEWHKLKHELHKHTLQIWQLRTCFRISLPVSWWWRAQHFEFLFALGSHEWPRLLTSLMLSNPASGFMLVSVIRIYLLDGRTHDSTLASSELDDANVSPNTIVRKWWKHPFGSSNAVDNDLRNHNAMIISSESSKHAHAQSCTRQNC